MDVSTHQICGAASVIDAIRSGLPVTVVLVRDDASDAANLARAAGIRVRTATDNDLRRMSQTDTPADVLALLHRDPDATVSELMSGPGPVWLLVGLSYPSNVGFILRTAEVTGAAGVVVSSEFSRKQRHYALRVSMNAERFMPVHFQTAHTALAAAREAGRQLIGLETAGSKAPWEVDLRRPSLLIVGAERDGTPSTVLSECDQTIRIPMPGFIPSLSVQAAVSALAVERLRQLES